MKGYKVENIFLISPFTTSFILNEINDSFMKLLAIEMRSEENFILALHFQ